MASNLEVFKTPEELTKAFSLYCSERAACTDGSCMSDEGCNECHFKWLFLEFDDGKKNNPLPSPLPCPYCGCDNIRIGMIEDTSDGYTIQPRIWCSKCGATHSLDWGPESELGRDVTETMKVELIEKWNRRV